MAGHFKVIAKTQLDNIKIGDTITESDFATTSGSGVFTQFEYVESTDTARDAYDVKPGIWTIRAVNNALKLENTEFVKDSILSSFVNTKNITDKIDTFFDRLHIYYKHGVEIPKMSVLLWGPAGSGKSTAISEVSKKYGSDDKTAVVIWPTDKFEAHMVKDFVKSFAYIGVERLILLVEDLGGVEIDQARMKSDSSLLSLLDNQEKTFTIPVCIISTTNFPENFLGNLTNRPGRFDVKIQVGYPKAQEREALLKFFSKDTASAEAIRLMTDRQTDEFSIAHIKHVVIYADLYDITIEEMINKTLADIKQYKNEFNTPKTSLQFGSHDDDDL